MFDVLLLCILFSSSCCFLVFVAFHILLFVDFKQPIKKTSLKKLEIAKKHKNEKCTNKGTF